MEAGKPSRTAFAAAAHRAVHQVLGKASIFRDPLALTILGADAERVMEEARGDATKNGMRMFIALRTRIAEDALAAAVEDGTRQLVVLGAGLDTFAYRSPYGERLKVFEVDFPATQAWKRERLAETGIAVPDWVRYVGVDFERETLAEGLAAAGFDAQVPTFFLWLGVVIYLEKEAIWKTLEFIAGLEGGAQVVFDYSDPPDRLSPEMQAAHDARAARVAAIGERWVSYFEPAELREKLLEIGFLEVEDLRAGQMVERYMPGVGAAWPRRGGHVLRAWTK
jgi:methyltransferase (TIGR00027 family)